MANQFTKVKWMTNLNGTDAISSADRYLPERIGTLYLPSKKIKHILASFYLKIIEMFGVLLCRCTSLFLEVEIKNSIKLN